MKNWMEFTRREYDQILDRIYSELKFSPSDSVFPSFKVPSPFVTEFMIRESPRRTLVRL
ncbi:Uncharacterized protein BW664_03089 [Bacillus mycoides]|nr:Uncharacterized protein BW664_03089 [Bacillus mycoides]